MFLKSLTLKGFKSFADKTTLEFQPGVCVVVGPNGSGKSNVVDSVAWVLGAQGARALRGGKMDDVIFAGTAQRAALGRAEVSLTIDNTAGLLPIEFTEVTITRTLFRTGESEYAINGAPCRLLDIQELLSDSGIGRQQHVIVGQGQLDTVLNARPEERRGIIEEAAGILKFRKRKEKAERRLDATEANLLRLTDLLREVRRQLRPLERQAEAARRHGDLERDLREVRLHLAGRELESLYARLERRAGSARDLATAEADLRARLRVLDADVVAAERALALPGDDDAADLLSRVESARERGRGLQALITERLRGIDRELEAAADEGVVETLVADAAALRAELAEVDADFANLAPRRDEVDAAEARVDELRRAIEEAGGAAPELTPEARERRAAEEALDAAMRSHREVESELAALRSRSEGLTVDEPVVRDELARVEADLATVAPELAGLEADEARVASARAELDARHAIPFADTDEGRRRVEAEAAAEDALAGLRAAETDASRWQARAETLALALEEAHAASGADLLADVDGVLGPLLDHLHIEAGYEDAVAAALGDAMHSLVVDGTTATREAVQRLRAGDAQALLLVVANTGPVPARMTPAGTRSLADCVRGATPALDSTVRRMLDGVIVTERDWQLAIDLALADPGTVVVTTAGDRFGGSRPWRAGPSGRSAVTAAALADAQAAAAAAEEVRQAAEEAVAHARTVLEAARAAEQALLAARQQERAALDADEQRVARARREFDVRHAGLAERRDGLTERLAVLDQRLAELPALEMELSGRLATAEADLELTRQRLATARRAELAAAEQLRAQRSELERLRAGAATVRRDYDVRGAEIEQRRTIITRRIDDVERRLAARPDEEAAARRRRAALTERRSATAALGEQLATTLEGSESLVEGLREQRRRRSEAAREAGARLDALRSERAEAERALSETRERQSRLEVEEAETRLRIEQGVEMIRRDFDCEPEAAIAAPAPEVPDGASLPQRARELERELRLLGPINPLALSEYEALVERHEFLQQQLDDVKNTRRELARVIKAVNEEIVTVFESAFAEVAGHFEQLFGTLFPGGSGRLVLTDPANPLDTGIEIEARPSGKTPRRLSLLSGGERSLTAMAYLFAVFRARPSPFYLLDEVEAALDDVNLSRFLDLIHEFRHEAQLLIVSHQKRTMETADVLYGVSMPPGGSTRVVSQRMRDLQLEDA